MQLTEKQLKSFFKRVNKIPGGCWVWTGNHLKTGYGRVSINNKTFLAHRAIYEHFNGKLPKDIVLDHLCRNPPCVNFQEHLEPVTHRINSLRGPSTLIAKNSAKTHCPQGHPYDEINTIYFYEKKRNIHCRRCRACSVIHNRNHWAKVKAN
jgi:hypothetical protein